MKLPICWVDAFTDKPFSGNPAGVCVLEQALPEAQMKSIALEVNASETAFLVKSAKGYDLRWFTPVIEVDLCGHGTLAAAHVLFSENREARETVIRFQTRSGELTARCVNDDWIQLDFPAIKSIPVEDSPEIERAIGRRVVAVSRTHNSIIAELGSEVDVRDARPDMAAILSLRVHGVIITARSSSPYDFVSRFFAPDAGVNEDPVTGSAHCALGPYWQRLLGKDKFLAYQASARGGIVKVAVVGDRVLLEGRAVTTINGEIVV